MFGYVSLYRFNATNVALGKRRPCNSMCKTCDKLGFRVNGRVLVSVIRVWVKVRVNVVEYTVVYLRIYLPILTKFSALVDTRV